MKNAEAVTFGGSHLDRAAELRPKWSDMLDEGQGDAVVLWRGKPLLLNDKLVRVRLDDAILADTKVPPIFLGRDGETRLFAADISAWTPEDQDMLSVGNFVDQSLQAHPLAPEGAAFAELRQVMSRLSARDAELIATAKAIYEWHRTHRFCSKCGSESRMDMGGWERACVACGGKHFPRTDPVVIMLITRGNQVLMGRSHFWPEGMYSLLAGFVEPGETIEAAVRREVYEESGIRVGQVDYLSSQPWPFPNSLMFGCHGAALNSDITIDPNELEDAFWVSREEIMLAFSGEHPKIKPARKGSIAHFLLQRWLADALD